METNKIYQGDCLELMKQIEDKSVNLILCDLPYGVTARNKWDVIIPFDKLWEQYKRIIKDDGVIILTATQPFASMLVMSNIKMFKYDLIWDKNKGSDFLNANIKPLNCHEHILIFYKKKGVYNPQKIQGKPYIRKNLANCKKSLNYGNRGSIEESGSKDGRRFPLTIITIPTLNAQFRNSEYLHPTQKPMELFEYLIKTYTNEGDLVLDNCIGSGTTAIACIKTDRNFIGMELSEEYIKMAEERILEVQKQTKLKGGKFFSSQPFKDWVSEKHDLYEEGVVTEK